MKLCIVGNGPSAEGHGETIDACDFVVRIKAWWAHGATNAGSRCDALAWYGGWQGFRGLQEPLACEHWLTQTVEQVQQKGEDLARERLAFLSKHAGLSPLRWATEDLWQRCVDYLDRHPSTGMMAVAMAMEIHNPENLVLYGFDGTTPDKPNYHDARRSNPDDPHAHRLDIEKRAIAEILKGRWLGDPTAATLTWPDMPEGL